MTDDERERMRLEMAEAWFFATKDLDLPEPTEAQRICMQDQIDAERREFYSYPRRYAPGMGPG